MVTAMYLAEFVTINWTKSIRGILPSSVGNEKYAMGLFLTASRELSNMNTNSIINNCYASNMTGQENTHTQRKRYRQRQNHSKCYPTIFLHRNQQLVFYQFVLRATICASV